jgi:phage gp45-like
MTNPLEAVSNVYRRVIHAIAWGKSTAPSNETGTVATVQVSYMNGFQLSTDQVMQNYGFASATLPGCDHLRVAGDGNSSKGVIVASNDNRHRPINMQAGESQMYDNKLNSFYLENGEAANIYIGGVLIFSVTAGGALLNGSLTVTQNVLGGTGATGSFSTPDGNIVTCENGIITNITDS